MRTVSICFIALIICIPSFSQQTTVYFDDFENGWGSWYADNGLWEVGLPVVGPNSPYSGQQCAGTDLDANYPSYANTRLVSPQIILPSGHIRLKFWHWFELAGGDWGEVQVTADGINWVTVSNPVFDNSSTAWTRTCADLSAFAGQTIRLGFYFYSDYYNLGMGWYIDDVWIVEGPENFLNPEDFELGVGDWSADNGIWQVGEPTNGPGTVHSGQNCAGTMLNDNYPSYANTRLVSPLITLTEINGQQPELFFWHWYIMSYGDQGQVQISVNEGEWTEVQGFGGPYNGSNQTWSQGYVPLSAFVNSTIRIGFYFTSDYYNLAQGWYIDDIRISGANVLVEENELSNKIEILQNYPNPFIGHTEISFFVKGETRDLVISIKDLSGKLVKDLSDGNIDAGKHTMIWDGSDYTTQIVSPGIYLVVFEADNFVECMKIIKL